MKNLVKWFGIIAFVIVIECLITACIADGDSNSSVIVTDVFAGTWLGTETRNNSLIKIVAADGFFKEWVNDKECLKGTYTVSENTVTIKFVEVNTSIIDGSDRWIFFAELSEPEKAYLGGSETVQINISGDSFTMLGSTYYKQ